MKSSARVGLAAAVVAVLALAVDQLVPDLVFGASTTLVSATSKKYVVVGWNTLGMHCISPSFSQMCILPPANTLQVQVIQPGNPPKVVTTGIQVTYSVENNCTFAGKTDFWDYADTLFGIHLPAGVGLGGCGLSGKMTVVGNHFEAAAIPLLPWNDQKVWNPYQTAIVSLRTTAGVEISRTRVVLPVSQELHCDKCHADNGDAGPDIATGTIEGNILTVHDNKNGTDLLHHQPVLCAKCHADNALGAPGDPSHKSLSLSMHGWHSSLMGDPPACYDCHPGSQTHCLRTAIPAMGPLGPDDPGCERCHGTLGDLAQSIIDGRQPWFQEPTCEQCHGSKYGTADSLYRNAQVRGAMLCAACHNSPHAQWPSQLAVDNAQPLTLQASPRRLGRCILCHTVQPTGTMFHR